VPNDSGINSAPHALVTRRVEETKVALRELRVNDTFEVKRPGGVVDVADPTDHGRDDP